MHRLTNIQALRGVAVLLVVARHLQLFAARAIGGEPALGIFLAGDMGVDLFFVISGFIMVAVHRRGPAARVSETADFLYRRFSRVYPLYWLYSLPVLAVYLWRPGWLHRFSFGMGIHPLSSFLLWPQQDWPLLGQAWSLVYEMYFYLVFGGLLLLPGRWFARGLLAWAGIVLAGHALLPTLPVLDRAETRLLFSLFALEFIAGALVGLAVQRWRELPARWGWLLVGFGVAWVVVAVMPLDEHLAAGERVFLYGLPAVALVYGAMALERQVARAPRLLTLVGDWSYSVYLSHIFVIATLARVVPLAWTRRPPTEILATAVCLGAVLLCGAASYYFLERPLLRLTRRWQFPATAAPLCDPQTSSVKRPLLILTPTLGLSPYLEGTVRCIDALDWPIRHVLVCPPGQIAALEARFPGRRVVADAGRAGGLYGALNAGLAAASDLDWTWFTYLNDDDLLTPKFAELLARHDAGSDPDSVGYGDVRTLDEHGASLGCMTVEADARYFPALLQGGISPVGQQGMIFGAPVVRALGGYDLQYTVCADLDFWARACAQGFDFRYYPLEVGCFRVRRGQISGAVSLLSEQMAEITRRHFPVPVSPLAKRLARWRYRWCNLPRYLARLRVVGFTRSLDVLQAGGRRAEAKHHPSPAGSAP